MTTQTDKEKGSVSSESDMILENQDSTEDGNKLVVPSFWLPVLIVIIIDNNNHRHGHSIS